MPKPHACTHDHADIRPATPWQLNALIVCPDCGAIWEWPTSGAKTRAETLADIRAAIADGTMWTDRRWQ